MATPEQLTSQMLSQQLQQLQIQFGAAMLQSHEDREIMKAEILALAAENRSLREQTSSTQNFLLTRQAQPGLENFSKQLKVEDFHGETGEVYRIFRMHLVTKFKRESYSSEDKLDFLSSRCQGPAGSFISRFTDPQHPNHEPLEFEEVLERLDSRYYGVEMTRQNDNKIEELTKTPLADAKHYKKYLQRFEKLQDHCSYSQSVLKQKFHRGLPQDIAVSLLIRLTDSSEKPIDFQFLFPLSWMATLD